MINVGQGQYTIDSFMGDRIDAFTSGAGSITRFDVYTPAVQTYNVSASGAGNPVTIGTDTITALVDDPNNQGSTLTLTIDSSKNLSIQ